MREQEGGTNVVVVHSSLRVRVELVVGVGFLIHASGFICVLVIETQDELDAVIVRFDLISGRDCGQQDGGKEGWKDAP